ncbi:hypothetical protein GCM10010466_09140 [Planomonospora alba]|uniref:PLD phosphodiesterase domain-containing protein n=1 Tax=Planomonospora alba TaxID=161354 RepID=A0ABP6MP57_9ACTN
MNQTTWRFSSPLSLLNDWRDRADQAPLHEVLLLGFTVDLPFLEQVAIPTARTLGARITVLGDAGQGLYDPIDVRLAGSSYLHSLVTCAGAFHPKLALLIGEDEVWLAVGSGNPTMSGWGANDELWTVAISSGGAIHPVIAQAGAWLRRLADADRVSMTPWTADLLREIAAGLATRPTAEVDPQVRLLDNLDEAFLHRLPLGPVDELCLYAPFTDAQAIGTLIDRLRPRSTVLGLQPRWTSYDGDALLTVLTGHDVELRSLKESTVRHGKLVQWRTGERLYGLVGSPNLTRSALCASTAEGGNCELAILAPLPEDLMPEGTAAEPETMVGRSTVRTPQPSPSLILLGALVHGKGLEVTLAKPQRADVVVKSSPDGSPGSWQTVGVIPPGDVTLRSTVPEASGSVVRAEMVMADGRVVQSPPVFAVNPVRCARRVAETGGPRLRREYTVEEVFTDAELAARFNADLIRLAEILSHGSGTRPAGDSASGTATRSVIEDRWSAHLEECGKIYGASLTGLVYGPAVAVLPDSSRLSRWNVTVSVTGETGEEDDPTEDGTDPEIDVSKRPVYRRWAGRWVDAVTKSDGLAPLPLRMLVAGMYVKLLAAGVWDSSDDSWREPLGRLTRTLVPTGTDDAPAETRGRLCAVIATCMALLSQDVSLTSGGPNDLLAARTWAAVESLVAEADPDLAEDLLIAPVQPHARVASRSELCRLIDLAADDDPFAEIRAEIDADGWEITEQDGLWEITGDFTNPTPVAARVATRIGASGESAAVLARTGTKWTLIAWRKPELVLLGFPASTWRFYRIMPPASPESRFSSADIASVPGLVGRTVHMSQTPPDHVRQVFADCGFDPIELRDRILRKQVS